MRPPNTREKLEEAGYSRRCFTRCQGCNRPMEFWITPAKKTAPFDPMPEPESPAVSHFATCPEADRFTKGKRE